MMRLLQPILCILTLFLSFSSLSQGSLQEVYQAGIKAYEDANYDEFLTNMKKAYDFRPNHPTILYNLSVAYALNGDKNHSVEMLSKVLWMNAELPYRTDDDLAILKGYEPYEKLSSDIEELKKPLNRGDEAFRLTDREFHPEGIAYSSKTKKFYVSSVRQRKIVTVDSEMNVEDFASGNGLMAIMGMKADDRRGLLWVCSTPAPEMMDFKNDSIAEIVCFNLKNGRIAERFAAPHSQAWLGDLTIGKDGTVYTTNSSAERPKVYSVSRKSGEMEVLIEPEKLVSIQGLALDEDESNLFIADYRYGIFKYNFESKSLTEVKSKVETSMKGVDGLYFSDGKLIAIHNGVRPFRIVRYELNESQDEIINYTFIEKALPEMNEPTLGVIKEGDLYYVTNSSWGAYDKNKAFVTERAEVPIIRKVKVKE